VAWRAPARLFWPARPTAGPGHLPPAATWVVPRPGQASGVPSGRWKPKAGWRAQGQPPAWAALPPPLCFLTLSLLNHPASLSRAFAALALIPDDDDLDLVVKARANRSARLSSEKTTEARFSAEGGAAKKVGPLAAAQKAVRKLSRSASALDAGSASDAAAALSGPWAADFAVAAAALSGDAASLAGKAAAAAVAAVDAYVAVARAGDLAKSKAGFVTAATAVQGWAKAAGVAAQLTGL
jgi:hypothetical protein